MKIARSALPRSVAILFIPILSIAKTDPTDLPDPLAAGWQGKPVCKKLHEDDSLRILRCTLAPGIGHEKHRHPKTFTYVLSGGKMKVIDAKGSREADVPTGANRMAPSGGSHEVVNIGDSSMSFLLVEPKSK